MTNVTRLPPEDYRYGMYNGGKVKDIDTGLPYDADEDGNIYILSHARSSISGVYPKSHKKVTGIRVRFIIDEDGKTACKLVLMP